MQLLYTIKKGGKKMAKLSIKRINLTGDITAVEFDRPCSKWLIKNFSDGDIYVGYEASREGEDFENYSARIAAQSGQVLIGNLVNSYPDNSKTNVLYIKGTGEVEVQQLCY